MQTFVITAYFDIFKYDSGFQAAGPMIPLQKRAHLSEPANGSKQL